MEMHLFRGSPLDNPAEGGQSQSKGIRYDVKHGTGGKNEGICGLSTDGGDWRRRKGMIGVVCNVAR